MSAPSAVDEKAIVVVCGYCGGVAELTDSAEVYGGRSYGSIYICRPCQAWVGCHPNTLQPLGTLAKAELRQWRNHAHASFDVLWRYKGVKRQEAYAWLAEKLNLTKEECHIGLFTIEQCKRVVQVCIQEQVGR